MSKSMCQPGSTISMVAILLVVSGLLVACGIEPNDTEERRDEVLTVASFGGSFQEALDREVIRPIEVATGLDVNVETYGGEYDRLAATIRNDTNPYDLVHVESSFLQQAATEDLTLPIDWEIVDRGGFVEGATHDYGVAVLAWALVPAWNESRLGSEAKPTGWHSLFDLETFPGPRCLRKTPEGNLELALLADGVAPDELYRGGLDVERALNKLTTIKPHLTWWSSGAELEQKLVSSCSLAAAWNGRVLNLKNSAGEPVSLTYDDAIHQYDWWVIPANTSQRDAAMQFLAQFGEGIGQQQIAEQFGYGPVSANVVAALPGAMMSSLPSSSENASKGVRFDSAWWAANRDRVQEEWDTWLLED